jgi:hypothetical protein
MFHCIISATLLSSIINYFSLEPKCLQGFLNDLSTKTTVNANRNYQDQNGTTVTINSDPKGVKLSIDGIEKGKTPYQGFLSYGSHILIFTNGDKIVTESINLAFGESGFYYFNVNEDIQVEIDSKPKAKLLSIDGKEIGPTPQTVNIQQGNHLVKLSNGRTNYETILTIRKDGKTHFNFGAKDIIRDHYRHHKVNLYLGYHSTTFTNKYFENNLSNGSLKKGFGISASLDYNCFPFFLEFSYFSSVFVTKNLDLFTGNIQHRGLEFTTLVAPFALVANAYPYIGIGYQFAQLNATSLTIGGSASVNISVPITKVGLRIIYKRLSIFGEYKIGFDINHRGSSSEQLNSGIGILF